MSSMPTEGYAGEPPDPLSSAPPKPGQPRWVRQRSGRLFSINWARWLASGKHIDPYLVWADLSHFDGFGGWKLNSSARVESGGRWPLLLELSQAALTAPLPPSSGACLDIFASMEIAALYKNDPDPNGQVKLKTRFLTARAIPDCLEQIVGHSDVLRLQLGMPRIPDTAQKRETASQQQTGGFVRIVIGIIDDGCAFAHPAFCSADGTTRVHFLWDQNADRSTRTKQGDCPDAEQTAAAWLEVERVGYGGELRHDALKRASRLAHERNNDEQAYASVDYGPLRLDLDRRSTRFNLSNACMPPGTMARSAHGTSVMYLAAGVSGDALEDRPLRQQRATSEPAGARAQDEGEEGINDFATRWPIVFVQLPTATTLDTSGGSLGVHVLDGIHYIIDRARCIPGDRAEGTDKEILSLRDLGSMNAGPAKAKLDLVSVANKVIINVSYGATAGPHDGTSILEQAMADVARESRDKDGYERNVWICLAAGNAHKSRTHARLSLRPGQSKTFAWQVPPDNPLQSFLEVWLPESDERGDALDEATVDRIALLITPPVGSPRRLVCGQAWTCQLDDESVACPQVVAGAVFSRRVAQGMRGTMALIAVAATRASQEGPIGAPHGQWLVEVSNETGESIPGVSPGRELMIHAWVERNDLVFGTPRGQQSTVEGEDPNPEPTEFTPDAWEFAAAGRRFWGDRHLPDARQPRPTLGSLAGAASLKTKPTQFYAYGPDADGQNVAVGGYRLADGEVAAYSSGGPQRHVIERSNGKAAPLPADRPNPYAATLSWPRNMPDVQAPSDIGPALRGLRTIGVRAGCTSRLSGTSAATPSVARVIANAQHANTWLRKNQSEQVSGQRFGATICESGVDNSRRPTPTPQLDDQFRRGRWRIR